MPAPTAVLQLAMAKTGRMAMGGELAVTHERRGDRGFYAEDDQRPDEQARNDEPHPSSQEDSEAGDVVSEVWVSHRFPPAAIDPSLPSYADLIADVNLLKVRMRKAERDLQELEKRMEKSSQEVSGGNVTTFEVMK